MFPLQNIKTHIKDLQFSKVTLKAARIFIEDIDINEKSILMERLKNMTIKKLCFLTENLHFQKMKS